ncbi:MAG TPA: thermonuclease family protein [Caulobacteraceae bacterium]|jgi:endonuclease YncB( thermonuclease family)
MKAGQEPNSERLPGCMASAREPSLAARALCALPLLALVALIAGTGCSRSKISFANDGYAEADVTVIDAGTISIEGAPIRLADIDVPKPAPDARCWAEALLAREARETLSVEVTRPFRVEIGAKRKTVAGRTVARVRVDGRDLSALLVERGLAAPTGGTAWDWCGPLDTAARNAPQLNYPIRPSESRPGA